MKTGGFRLKKVSALHVYPFHSEETPHPLVLDQTFHYLGKGVQFYVFLGEDNQTILKLFKHHHFGMSTDQIKKHLPKMIAAPLVKKREKRMSHLFQSAEIAYKELRNETGLLYTHLSKSSSLPIIALYDKMKIRRQIDLNQTEFIVQIRAETVANRLNTLFSKGNVKEAITDMDKVLNLLEARSKKGIKNKDGNVLENCGFIDSNPIELDIGSFTYRNQSTHPDPHKKARMKATLELLGWVKKYYPQYLQECKKGLLYEKAL